jgi:translation initiation factor 2 subunit 2
MFSEDILVRVFRFDSALYLHDVDAVEYVTCKTCKSHDTLLTKENRIFFMSCESCGSRRSVNPIKSGFQAQVGKRSKNKTG